MEIGFYFKQFINMIKASRKHALYAESRFLHNLNRHIQTTDYKALISPPPFRVFSKALYHLFDNT